MSWRENKAEWKTSAARFFFLFFNVWVILYRPPLAHTAPWWTARGVSWRRLVRPGRKRQNTVVTLLQQQKIFLKFIEIDWFLQIIVKLILPLNIETKRGRAGRPQHQNRRLMAVEMCRDQYYQLKNKHTRALKSAWNKTAVKTGQFFFFLLII